MRISLHPDLEALLSRNFIKNHLPNLVFNLQPCYVPHREAPEGSAQFVISREDFLRYWKSDRLTAQHRKSALCFFSAELIELVNQTNSRLLYQDFLKNLVKAKEEQSEQTEEEFQLLNSFEMLWNVGDQSSGGQDSLVFAQKGEVKTGAIKGHALTVKEEFFSKEKSALIEICERVRNQPRKHSDRLVLQNFLESQPKITAKSEKPPQCFPIQLNHATDEEEWKVSMLMIPSEDGENALIRAIDSEKIESWQQFEYVLSFILENRFLRIYQQFLQSQYKLQAFTEEDSELSSLVAERAERKRIQNRKKKQAKKYKKRALKEQEETELALVEFTQKMAAKRLQRWWRARLARPDNSTSLDFSVFVDYTSRIDKLFDFTHVNTSIPQPTKRIGRQISPLGRARRNSIPRLNMSSQSVQEGSPTRLQLPAMSRRISDDFSSRRSDILRHFEHSLSREEQSFTKLPFKLTKEKTQNSTAASLNQRPPLEQSAGCSDSEATRDWMISAKPFMPSKQSESADTCSRDNFRGPLPLGFQTPTFFNSPACCEGPSFPENPVVPYFQSMEQFEQYLGFAQQFGMDREQLVQRLLFQQPIVKQPVFSVSQEPLSQCLASPLCPLQQQQTPLQTLFQRQLESQMSEEEIVAYYRDQERQSANLSFMKYNMARQQGEDFLDVAAFFPGAKSHLQ